MVSVIHIWWKMCAEFTQLRFGVKSISNVTEGKWKIRLRRIWCRSIGPNVQFIAWHFDTFRWSCCMEFSCDNGNGPKSLGNHCFTCFLALFFTLMAELSSSLYISYSRSLAISRLLSLPPFLSFFYLILVCVDTFNKNREHLHVQIAVSHTYYI